LWWQDFPLKTEAKSPSNQFEETLVDYVEHLGVDATVSRAIKKYDFGRAQVKLVTSVPGLFVVVIKLGSEIPC
jgi:hypothetical protein